MKMLTKEAIAGTDEGQARRTAKLKVKNKLVGHILYIPPTMERLRELVAIEEDDDVSKSEAIEETARIVSECVLHPDTEERMYEDAHEVMALPGDLVSALADAISSKKG